MIFLRNERDVLLSKRLAWLLRHGANKEGLLISSEGYVAVDNILKHKSIKDKFNTNDLQRVVKVNSKQRFKLRFNKISNQFEIKANQGHTIKEVVNSELTPILEAQFNSVVHGTYLSCWDNIKKFGLSRMKRNHIHLAKGTLEDRNIISGLRANVQVYIFINIKLAILDGIKFYESENGVILTPGNVNGFLATKYFSKAVEVKTGYKLYP